MSWMEILSRVTKLSLCKSSKSIDALNLNSFSVPDKSAKPWKLNFAFGSLETKFPSNN